MQVTFQDAAQHEEDIDLAVERGEQIEIMRLARPASFS